MAQDIDIRRVAGNIGAEITGIKVGPDLAGPDLEVIRTALHEHWVVFLRGQHHLDDETHKGFARLFGNVTAATPFKPDCSGVLSFNAQAGGGKANAWHTDATYVDRPPSLSFLRAITLPPYGGETVWANTAAAYAGLAPGLRELAGKLRALHSNDCGLTAARGRGEEGLADRDFKHYQETYLATIFETEHPVVRVHPETGDPALLLGQFVRHIIGVPPADSATLYDLFQRHVTRLENTVRWHWSPGDLAIWDNRATQHYAIDDYGDLPRIMRRVTIAGELPVGVDGKPSVALAGDSTGYVTATL
jgi:alpha-ketoglutarate-dependent sulfate ester dioxygenase